jgi:hypothetical protein
MGKIVHLLPVVGLSLFLAVACSDEDPSSPGGSAGSSGAAGSGTAGSGGSNAGGSSGASGNSCVDPRTEPSLIPLTDAAGSGVWSGFQIDGGELFFQDLDGVYAQPLAGGARRTVYSGGASRFQVVGDKVRFVQGLELREVSHTGGNATTLNQIPTGHSAALFTPGGLVIHDQSLLVDDGKLSLLGYDGAAPVAIAPYSSKIPPDNFALLQGRIFFRVGLGDFVSQLVSVPLAGGQVTPTEMPTGLRFQRILGVAGSSLYAAAEDDFLKNTVLKIDVNGAITASYVVSSGTAMAAVEAEGGVAIGGIEFLDLWRDGQPAAERVRCFQVGAGVSSPFPTIHDYAASGKDVFLSIRTPEPNQNAIQQIPLP